MNKNIKKNNHNFSIAGEPLPQELVKALKNYQSSKFNTKSKEELLAMLLNNNNKYML